MKVRIIFDDKYVIEAQLFDTPCAKAIYEILPIDSIVNRWGDEFYFTVPLYYPLDETATVDVNVGDIGYWPPGRALAIFFGPTPMSSDEKPVPYSEVNLVGKILCSPKILKELSPFKVKVERR